MEQFSLFQKEVPQPLAARLRPKHWMNSWARPICWVRGRSCVG